MASHGDNRELLLQPTQHGSDEGQPLLAVAVAAGDYIDVDRLDGTATANSSANAAENGEPEADPWTPPPGFAAIQLAIMANVFLAGFDGTITASTYAVISSEFGAANAASWLTTSYLVTSTAFQPLYGRVSDLVGRRACFLVSTAIFAAGCLGCAAAPDMLTLNCMRALAGLGGSGLMTMATIVNSDLVPFRRRGMYQALQNGVFGFGAICGASFGGTMTDTIGWRWCFALQVPVSVVSFVMGGRVLRGHRGRHADDADDVDDTDDAGGVFRARSSWWSRIDVTGAVLLVAGISVQLVGLSLGGNELPWSSPVVWLCLGGSVVLLALFVRAERRPEAAVAKQIPPIIPLRMLRGRLPLATQATNICVGLAAYAYLFSLPLFFQVVLQDSPTKAGARLAIPALATPIGGLVAGVVMSRWNGSLATLVRAGAVLMVLGNSLVASFAFDAVDTGAWRYFVYTVPANLGQGIVYPGLLFTSLATFDHADHAVSASAVYLVRSLGMVWGVAITSAIVQTTLSTRLPAVLRDGLGDGGQLEQIVNDLRHSVAALYDLPPELQRAARHVYYEGLQYSFTVSAVVAGIALASSLLIHSNGLRNTSGSKN